jgi:hypothetical protein
VKVVEGSEIYNLPIHYSVLPQRPRRAPPKAARFPGRPCPVTPGAPRRATCHSHTRRSRTTPRTGGPSAVALARVFLRRHHRSAGRELAHGSAIKGPSPLPRRAGPPLHCAEPTATSLSTTGALATLRMVGPLVVPDATLPP